jgi:broad specificity phosphatase PhoE
MSSRPTIYVIVARHGERWDYKQRDAGKGREWIRSTERPWDPPLSPNGLKQATRMGQHLAKKLQELRLPPVSAVFSSPFLRCRQTACQAIEEINNISTEQLKVQIELGLTESLNQSWYRSWCLPDSDTTWGFCPKGTRRRELHEYDATELHPSSIVPVQRILNWKDVETHSVHESDFVSNELLRKHQDLVYDSSTTIDRDFALKPTVLLETKEEQEERMFQVLQRKVEQFSNSEKENKTFMVVSHGGPVVHLYTRLANASWQSHGNSKYCCYSIYEYDPDHSDGGSSWTPLLVNESKYLDELWSDASANI